MTVMIQACCNRERCDTPADTPPQKKPLDIDDDVHRLLGLGVLANVLFVLASFPFTGVKNDIAVPDGFVQCHSSTYDRDFSLETSALLAACNESQIIVACRTTGIPL